MKRALAVLGLLALPLAAEAQEGDGAADRLLPPMSLDQALRTARAHQPKLWQARAATRSAEARADEAMAPLLPQISGVAGYTRQTANFAPRPGQFPSAFVASGATTPSQSFHTFDYFNFGLTVNQLVYDFGQTSGRYAAARTRAQAQATSERASLLQVELDVRVAYFAARARRRLVEVAREALGSQTRHLEQIEGFVDAGTRPSIDRAQARADRASARVDLINAENDYELAKAQLNQAMGAVGDTSYDVIEDVLPPVDGEEAAAAALEAHAVGARPEVIALAQQARAQEQTIRAIQGGYGPSIGIQSGLTDAGTEITNLAWNWSAGATISWPLFQGGLTRAQVREARADLDGLGAQLDGEKLQIRLEVDQARLGIRAAKSSLGAVREAVEAAAERLRLAEARYESGAGNAIELGDARVALTRAEGQQVQSEYDLATARARLLAALGRHH